VKASRLWGSFQRIELSVNMRAGEHEKVFGKYLLDVGANNFKNPSAVPKDCIPVPPEFIFDSSHNKEALIDAIFGEDLSVVKPEDICNRAILCP